MARRIGLISINLVAGTAEFNAATDKAKASIRSFGQAATAAGAAHAAASHTTVSGMQASSAAIRVMEGGMTNNLRAVERFVAGTLKLGPVLQAAFPLIGGLAFLGLMTKMATEAFNFFAKMSEGPSKVAAAFRELNAPLRNTNNELLVSNDRLRNDIATLEGTPKNNFKLAMDVAAEAADKLADAMAKVVTESQKVLGETAPKWYEKISEYTGRLERAMAAPNLQAGIGSEAADMGKAQALDPKTALDRMAIKIPEIQNRAQDAIDAARAGGSTMAPAARQKMESDAIRTMNQALLGEYQRGLDSVNAAMAAADSVAAKARLAQQAITLRREMAAARSQIENTGLQATKTGLEDNAAGKAKKPHDDEALRRSQEETNRLIRELAAAEEKNLDAFGAIDLKQQEMLREAREAITVKGAIGPGIVPQQNIDLIQQITDQARLTESVKEYVKTLEAADKALDEYYKNLANFDAIVAKSQKESADEASRTALRIGDIQRSSALGASTRQAGLADRMAEMGGGSAESKINSAYERRVEIANQLAATQTASLAQEFAGQLSQKQSDDLAIEQAKVRGELDKALDEARIERQLKLAELRQQEIKEITGPLMDGMASQMAKLMTGQKTSFAKMFQSVGESMATSGLKKLGQQGLDAFGKTSLGQKLGLGGKKDGQAAATALWVQLSAGGAGATQPGGAFARLPGMSAMPSFGSQAAAPGGAASATGGFEKALLGAFGLGGLFGPGGGGGGTPAVSSSISYMAGGGDMSADKAYIAGENGMPEIISGINAHVTSNSDSRKLLAGGGGDTHNYTIDARGTDPVQTEERVRNAIMAAHNSAVSTSQQVSADRVRRTPTKASR